MGAIDPHLSRISKLFADRDQISVDYALQRRSSHMITLICGADVAASYTLQLAVLTAARLAMRCFPGAVRIVLPYALRKARCKLWPSLGLTFGQCLADIVSPGALLSKSSIILPGRSILFGEAADGGNGLRATFDGWTVRVGPQGTTPRLPEREYCTLAGILCAALAVSEAFLAFADISLKAGRRTVELSLWRPDLPIDHPDALGVPVQFLPKEVWLLGLGHLGNAYLWALASLPYRNAKEARFFLNDFDKVEDTNAETGIIFNADDAGSLKTRVLTRWLEKRDFTTQLMERRFDGAFRVQDDEPKLALCGFDSNPARRNLATTGFRRAVESGLGGMTSNFDAISLHTFPNERTAEDLWPDLDERELEKEAERARKMASDNPAYAGLPTDECGRVLLAGKSIAVPFVGATAATLVVAETLRILHRGPAYGQIKLRLSSPETRTSRHLGNYRPEDAIGIRFASA